MFKSIERFAELYEKRGSKIHIFKDILWTEYQRMVVPVGPASMNFSISHEESKFILSKFSRALLVRFTDGFQGKNSCKEWYAVTCNKFTELNSLSANTRSKINRGFKNCVVKMIDSNLIAEQGYHVYASALLNYTGATNQIIT